MLERLGGTKFLMALIAMAIGTAVELLKPGGIGPTFASLLAGLMATYGVANTVITNKALGTPGVIPSDELSVKENNPVQENNAEPLPVGNPVQIDYIVDSLNKQGELLLNIAQSTATTQKLLANALNQK